MQEKVHILFIFLFALLLRWCIAYHPYSGHSSPPMFGDYEAQRHWQEITVNLPVKQWYKNSTENNLLYWGLDYPPLSAYHSLLLGHIAGRINPSYIELYNSRGLKSPDHKYFMRLTVLSTDAVIYMSAILYFIVTEDMLECPQDSVNFIGFKYKHVVLLTTLLYPGIILIDHGHFQYNCVSLGFFVLAISLLFQSHLILGSVFFVCALNYKQMELYHALPIFFYILAKTILGAEKSWLICLKQLTFVSVTVILMFALIWLPFLHDWDVLKNVVLRLFPLARGVFEDKVSNVWCALNVIYKLGTVFTNEEMAQLCLIATAIAVLPSNINLFLHPTKNKFLLCLINCSLGFFLFSFQVHEKSILLVASPVLLYFHNDPLFCFWFLLISHFSMLPLFIKDDLYCVYIISFTFYFFLTFWTWYDMFIFNSLVKTGVVVSNEKQQHCKIKYHQHKLVIKQMQQPLLEQTRCNPNNNYLHSKADSWIWIVFCYSMLGVITLSITSKLISPPKRYPDLFSLLVSLYSCVHFIIFYLYFNYQQFYMTKNSN